MKRKNLSSMTKYANVLITAIIAVILYSASAFAANHTILKTTGTLITIPSYNAGDTLIITGDALETTPDDWGKLKALTKNFALVMQNNEMEIPEDALRLSTRLVSLDLSDAGELSKIGEQAFQGCSKLATIDFSGLSHLETIGLGAFWDCTALKSLDLSGVPNLKTIEERAFSDCTALKIVNLSGLNQLQLIGNFAFNECTSLTDVQFSGVSTLTTIGFGAFGYCDALVSIDLSELTNLTTISSRAFNYSHALKSVNLSGLSQLKTIGSYAFTACSSLEEVLLAGVSNLNSIGANAFAGCSALAKIDFTALTNLTVLDNSAFEYCSALSTIDLSGLGQLTNINTLAFHNCTELKTIKLLGLTKLSTISSTAFYGAIALDSIAIDRETPPSLVGNPFDNTNESPIYVPMHLVATYKSKWSRYAHRIQGMEPAVMPFAAPIGGAFKTPPRVALSTETPSAAIYYTLDGSDPITNPNGTRQTYMGPLTVALGTTVKAFAQSPITAASPVMTEIYSQDDSGGGGGGGIIGIVASPVATPPGGAFDGPQTISLTTTTSGATIYFTLDCSDPITSPTRQKYTGPITIQMGTMLKAYAVKPGMHDSGLLIQCFTQKKSVAMPIASPPGGIFSSAQTVCLSSETLGSTIYYTLDGSDPVTNPNGTRQMHNNKRLHIPLGTTLKAYAAKDGLLPSAVLTETYTLHSESCGGGGGCNNGISAASLGLLLAGAIMLGKKKR